MKTSMTFRRGEEIDQLEAGTRILQKYWKTFAPTDGSDWKRRITNSGGYIAAAYVGNVLAGILEGMKLDLGGDASRVPRTFQELTANGTWSTHKPSGDTVMLVDLTIAPEFHSLGIFEAFIAFAKKTFLSPSGSILTYSPLFLPQNRYWVVNKHERFGAVLKLELPASRPGLKMVVAGAELIAEDVGITAYTSH